MIFKLKGHQKEHRSRVKEEVTKEIIHELDELVTKELLEIDKDTDLEYVKDKLMYDFLKYYNLNITVVATKYDKIKSSLREKTLKIEIAETISELDSTRDDKQQISKQ